MNLKGRNKVVVTREFEWRVACSENNYVLSDIFKISLDEILTTWQLVLYSLNYQLFVNLHKIKASSDDFVVNLRINGISIAKYDGHCFDRSWNKTIFTGISIFKISLERRHDVTNIDDPGTYLSNYEKLFNTQTLSDFKFICSDGKEIPAHRFVLIAHSPVMFKMLMTPMTEAKTQTAKLDDINGETMLEVLRFLDIRKIENIEILATNLLYCAEKYELEELKSYVVRSMDRMISVENVLDYLKMAECYDENELLKSCLYFMKRNYSKLLGHDEWDKIDTKLKLMFEVTSNCNVTDEVFVLKTLCTYTSSKLPAEYKTFP